ncbi:MAG: cell division protein FtsA [Muribaculaceae bacterium]|nr:cell division protein FtsA [Muribaculaceae bacterium]
MEKKQYIAALEIGSSKISGVIALKEYPEGNISILAVEEVPTSESVRYGCIKNVEEAKHCIAEVLHRLENRMNGAKINSIYMNLAGRSIRNVTTQVNRHLDVETAITQETINSLLQEGRQVSMKGFDVLDVVPRRFMVDNVEVKKPVGTFGSDISATLNTIVGKSIIKTNLHRVIDPNIKVNDIIITPLAVGNSILSFDERQLGCMLIDFGAETTTISIYKNDALIYLATLPLGGRNITRDIMSLNLLEDKAEELKLSIGNAMANDNASNSIQVEGITVADVSKYVVARSGEIAANINEQLNYAEIKADELGSGIVLIGGGSHLNGFIELLEKTTKLKVRRGGYPSHVNILDTKAQNSNSYIQAVSIAVQAAESIAPDSNCLTQIEKKAEPVQSTTKPALEVSTEDTEKKKEKTKGKLSKLLTGFKNIFQEGEDDGDDNY